MDVPIVVFENNDRPTIYADQESVRNRNLKLLRVLVTMPIYIRRKFNVSHDLGRVVAGNYSI